jgi:hypothetical protein
MSSPKCRKHLVEENSIDFNKMNLFIQSVDDRKPLGKLVKMYADQKWFDGWNSGFPQGFLLGVICGGIFGFTIASIRR